MDLSRTSIRQLTDPSEIRPYTTDESGAFAGHASAVVLPRSADEVAEVVSRARASRSPLTVSGAGTSITGSRVPDAGVVLSTERLRSWRAVMPEAIDSSRGETDWVELAEGDCRVGLAPYGGCAVVPAGERLAELDRLRAPRRRLYPPDPTELTAMLGGTIATNASGARSYRYGATREWIDGLLVCGLRGEPVWVRRGEWVASRGVLPLPEALGGGSLDVSTAAEPPETKNAAGLMLASDVDLVDLIVGSEGVLAVVIAALVRLAPRPEPLVQIAGFFGSAEDAFAAADEARDDPDVLSIEYFDERSLAFMRRSYPDTPDAGSCVMFEIEYDEAARHNPYPRSETLDRWAGRFANHHAVDDWTAAGEELAGMKSFRHALPEQVNRWVRERVGKLGTDMAVPADRFADMHRRYREAQSAGIRTVLFGHLGQYHLHLNFLPENRHELDTARRLYLGLARAAVAAGGTVSAEHGVGRKRLADENGVSRPYLSYLVGEAGMRAIARVKRRFDPDWLLNPGCMVEEP